MRPLEFQSLNSSVWDEKECYQENYKCCIQWKQSEAKTIRLEVMKLTKFYQVVLTIREIYEEIV